MKSRAIYIFLILHLIFIGAALYENAENYIKSAFLFFIIFTLIFFYLRTHAGKTKSITWDIGPEIIFSIAGAVFTFFLQNEMDISAVMAAGLVGLAGSFIPNLNKKKAILKKLSPAVYCGAFVGMTSGHIASYPFIILAGAIAGIILILSRNTFIGMGGKLGSVAFGGVVLVSAILALL